MRIVLRTFAALALAAGLVACAAQERKPPTLYERLGGQPAIAVVVDDFVANIAADSSIAHRFAKTDIPKLKRLLNEQICEATGGPCKYTGRDMVASHKGMNITVAEFNATGAALQKALQKHGVPKKEQDELLTAIGSMQDQIVGK